MLAQTKLCSGLLTENLAKLIYSTSIYGFFFPASRIRLWFPQMYTFFKYQRIFFFLSLWSSTPNARWLALHLPKQMTASSFVFCVQLWLNLDCTFECGKWHVRSTSLHVCLFREVNITEVWVLWSKNLWNFVQEQLGKFSFLSWSSASLSEHCGPGPIFWTKG